MLSFEHKADQRGLLERDYSDVRVTNDGDDLDVSLAVERFKNNLPLILDETDLIITHRKAA